MKPLNRQFELSGSDFLSTQSGFESSSEIQEVKELPPAPPDMPLDTWSLLCAIIPAMFKALARSSGKSEGLAKNRRTVKFLLCSSRDSFKLTLWIGTVPERK